SQLRQRGQRFPQGLRLGAGLDEGEKAAALQLPQRPNRLLEARAAGGGRGGLHSLLAQHLLRLAAPQPVQQRVHTPLAEGPRLGIAALRRERPRPTFYDRVATWP